MSVGVLLGILVLVAVGVALAVCVSDGFGVYVLVDATVFVGIAVLVSVGVTGMLFELQAAKNTKDRPKIMMRAVFNKDSTILP